MKTGIEDAPRQLDGDEVFAKEKLAVRPVGIYTRLAAVGVVSNQAIRSTLTLYSRRLGGLVQSFRNDASFEQPFLYVPLFLGCGAALWFSLSRLPDLRVIATLFAATILASALSGWRGRLGLLFQLCGVFAAGMLLAQYETSRLNTTILDDAVTTTIRGVVVDIERARGGRQRYTLDVLSLSEPVIRRPPDRVRLTGLPPAGEVFPGSIMQGRVRLSPPSGPAMPEGHDFAFGAYFEGLGAIGYFLGRPALSTMQAKPSRRVISQVVQVQSRISLAVIDRLETFLSGDALGFASAILVNDRRSLSSQALEALRSTGLAHIIAISGLHMALASGMFFWTLRALFSLVPNFSQRHNVKKVAAMAALLAAAGYLFVSGAPISAQRAFIMLSIILIAVLLDRPAISLRNLAIAAVLILLIAPSSVMSAGFQMSFGATAALVAGYKIWRKWRVGQIASGRARYVTRFFGGIALTSFIGGLSTGLFAVVYFHSFPAMGLVANLLAMPVFTLLVIPAALLAAVLSPFGLDGLLWRAMGVGLDTILKIASTVQEIGNVQITGQVAGWVLPVGALLLFGACLLRSSIRYIAAAGYVLCLLGAILMTNPQVPDFLIFEDGYLVAAKSGRELAVNRPRPAEFVVGQWRGMLKVESFSGPESVAVQSATPPANTAFADAAGQSDFVGEVRRKMQSTSEQLQPGRFLCEKKLWCMAKAESGQVFVVLDDHTLIGPACDIADIIVSRWRHGFNRCRSGAVVIDRETLRHRGSISIYAERRSSEKISPKTHQMGRGVSLVGALDGRHRAWNRHRYYNWRTGQFDAPARNSVSDSGG